MKKIMKKMPAILLAGIIAVAFAFAIGTVTAQEAHAESYSLWVGGVQVTNANAGDILENGTASYNAATHTLTLEDATIQESANSAIRAYLANSDLTIELIGKNILISGTCGIETGSAGVIIKGSGSLEIMAPDYGIYSEGDISITETTVTISRPDGCRDGIFVVQDLTITDSTVTVTNITQFAINTDVGDIAIKGNSKVKVESSSNNAAICSDQGEVSIADGLAITNPANGRLSDNNSYITYSNGWSATSATIEPLVEYELYVGGVQVTNANAGEILGVDSGKASYDAETKTLTLDGASITGLHKDYHNICANIRELEIELKGENKISDGQIGLWNDYGVTITGGGSLEVKATASGICSQGDITFDGATVTAIATDPSRMGIYSVGAITIKGSSKVHAEGQNGAIVSEDGITIGAGLAITKPGNGRLSDDEKTIVDQKGAIATSATIEPLVEYELYVGGVQVTNANAGEILGVDSGKASYDAETKTLTLDGASITGLYDNLSNIYADIPDFKIELKGKNKLSGGWDGIDAAGGGVTITGGGSLEVRATTFGIYSPRSAITIDGATVTAVGTSHDGHGIFSADAITIKGSSKVHAEGQTGAITGVSGITIGEGLAITEPENGSIFLLHLYPDTYMIVDQYDTPATSATIEPVYTLTLAKTVNGKATLSAEKAVEGEKVTVTATPDKGYLVDKMTYTDKNGKTKTIPSSGVITMPASDITVPGVTVTV